MDMRERTWFIAGGYRENACCLRSWRIPISPSSIHRRSISAAMRTPRTRVIDSKNSQKMLEELQARWSRDQDTCHRLCAARQDVLATWLDLISSDSAVTHCMSPCCWSNLPFVIGCGNSRTMTDVTVKGVRRFGIARDLIFRRSQHTGTPR